MYFPYTPCLKNRWWEHWRWRAIMKELCLCAFFLGPAGVVGSKWTTSHRCRGRDRMICTSLPNAQRSKHSGEYFFFLDRTKTDLMEESACCSLTSAVCFFYISCQIEHYEQTITNELEHENTKGRQQWDNSGLSLNPVLENAAFLWRSQRRQADSLEFRKHA